jgi:aspartyl-tRNA(Asn)/glutamyl-tRNA(Gln) amidotransferase subunit A
MNETRGAGEATEACLGNIERHNGAVNAMITPLPDAARSEAAAADRAASEGQWLGLLHGMPVAIKDNIDTAGVRSTSGSLLYENNIPNSDAPVVSRLRAAGAVIVGKATMHELAFGVRSNNPISGQCHNPWNLDHVPGGSSGGSGAAVAAEMCIGALGTDTGGSVRVPASVNGVTGLRPTHGSIPISGISPVSVSHDTVGPLARRVEDVARLFAVLCGFAADDPQSRERQYENFLPALGQGIAGIRIGIPSRFYYDDLLPEVEAAVRAAAQVFEGLGAELREIAIEGAEDAHRWTATIVYADMVALHGEAIKSRPEMFSDQVRERIATGFAHTGADVARALGARDAWRRTMRNVYDEVDMTLVPTIPGEVPPIEDSRTLLDATHDATRFTYGGALAAIPGLSLFCGFTNGGLPIGVMLEAAWWNEPLLFRAGYAYQQETGWHLRRAPILDA